MHLHGVPMDENDDKGRPPYPIVDQLSNDEVYDDDNDDDVHVQEKSKNPTRWNTAGDGLTTTISRKGGNLSPISGQLLCLHHQSPSLISSPITIVTNLPRLSLILFLSREFREQQEQGSTEWKLPSVPR